MNQPLRKRELIKRDEQGQLVPVVREIDTFDLETSFLEQEPQHRWLLTTCIAGLAGTVLVGGLVLGLFGRNATPVPAHASVQPNTPFFSNSTGDADKQLLAEPDLYGGYASSEINQGDLPYRTENTRVLAVEIKPAPYDGENIPTIPRASTT